MRRLWISPGHPLLCYERAGPVMPACRDRNTYNGAEFPIPAIVHSCSASSTLPTLSIAEACKQRRLGAARDTPWVAELTDICRSRTAALRPRDQRRKHRPLLISKVTQVPNPPAIITRTIFLGPHWHLHPANQTIIRESQMTQANQKVFGQALRGDAGGSSIVRYSSA